MLLVDKAPEVSPKVEARITSLLVLYGMTGFSGLLAEQALEKYVTLLVGATASASAVIVFTYFLGFAVGGLAVASLLKRGLVRNPLRAYAGIELLTGCACIVFSFGFHAAMATLAPLQNLFAGDFGRYLVRFFCACILVLPIAALMGASFPLLAQALDDTDARGPKRWSVIYSANLAGAALASIAAPFVLLPAIGLRGAMWLCFAICAAVAIFVQARPARETPAQPRLSAGGGNRPWQSEWSYLLMASFLSGAVFFALEIIWTHLIGAVVGGSVYAFSWMLTGVLAGLWAGSWLVNRSKDMRVAKVFQLCAFTLLIQLSVWQFAPGLFAIAPSWIYKGFYTRELYRLLVACFLIVPSACSLGLIFPTLLKNPRTRPEDSAWFAGYLSAANSVGCLAGALLSSLVLVNSLGSELSLKLITLILGVLWLFFYFREPSEGFRSRLVTAILTVMLIWGTIANHWDWRYLTSGISMYFGEVAAAPAAGAAGPAPVVRSSIVFRDESIQGGFTTVVDTSVDSGAAHKTVRALYTNGKLQSNDDAEGEVQAQELGTATIPSLFTKHFNKALLIGLGSGHTASVLKEVGFEQLDIAELSPGIVRAVNATFHAANHGVLDDPTVHCTLEDGRNLLLTSADARYDLISVGLTTIWFSGATNLYSREFYQLARQHLSEDGMLEQWVQLHRIGPDEIGSAIATMRSVFPYVSYWRYGVSGMVIASNHPLAPQAGRPEHLVSRLNQYGGLPLKASRDLVDQILRGRLLSEPAVDRLIRERRPVINTDHNRHIEYATPKYSSSQRDWFSYNIAFLKQWDEKP
jgi:spermidine synthase